MVGVHPRAHRRPSPKPIVSSRTSRAGAAGPIRRLPWGPSPLHREPLLIIAARRESGLVLPCKAGQPSVACRAEVRSGDSCERGPEACRHLADAFRLFRLPGVSSRSSPSTAGVAAPGLRAAAAPRPAAIEMGQAGPLASAARAQVATNPARRPPVPPRGGPAGALGGLGQRRTISTCGRGSSGRRRRHMTPRSGSTSTRWRSSPTPVRAPAGPARNGNWTRPVRVRQRTSPAVAAGADLRPTSRGGWSGRRRPRGRSGI
jgi:hypothetical protein